MQSLKKKLSVSSYMKLLSGLSCLYTELERYVDFLEGFADVLAYNIVGFYGISTLSCS
jgi:hypothetical protein